MKRVPRRQVTRAELDKLERPTDQQKRRQWNATLQAARASRDPDVRRRAWQLLDQALDRTKRRVLDREAARIAGIGLGAFLALVERDEVPYVLTPHGVKQFYADELAAWTRDRQANA